MKYVKQFLIIITISFIGEILSYFIPLPIPAGIYGLVLMFLALFFKLFPVTEVKETSKFMIEAMPIMFIPPGVAILDSLDVLKAHWWQIVLMTVISTILVMVVTGWVSQLVMMAKKKILIKERNKEEAENGNA